jgi:hypothetical protein
MHVSAVRLMRTSLGFVPATIHPVYPETVLFRLVNSNGRPNVKIEATEQGPVLGLMGESDPTYASLGAKNASTTLKLTNKDGRQQLIKP